MSDELFNGRPSSEAMSRISSWNNQKSEEHPHVSRPSATNNRGFAGHRESHAYGEMVGQENNMPQNNYQPQQRPMQGQNPEMHANGGEVGNSALPSQGGCHQKAPYGGRGNTNLPSQGGSRGTPMSGHMEAPRNKYGRQNHAHGEDVREGHSFGSFVRGAAKTVGHGIKSAAKTVGSDVKKGVNEVGSGIKTAAKEAAPILKQGAKDVYSSAKKEVGNTARNLAKNGAKNLMNYAAEAPAVAAKRGGSINR